MHFLTIYNTFAESSILKEILTPKPDFIVDAIDTVKSKLALIGHAKENNIPLVVESETLTPSGIEEARICIEYLKSLEK